MNLFKKKRVCPTCNRAKVEGMADGTWRCQYKSCDKIYPTDYEQWWTPEEIKKIRAVGGKQKCCAPVNDTATGDGFCNHFATSKPRNAKRLKKYDSEFRGMLCTAHYWQVIANTLVDIIEEGKQPAPKKTSKPPDRTQKTGKDLIIEGVKFEPEEQSEAIRILNETSQEILGEYFDTSRSQIEAILSKRPITELSELAVSLRVRTWADLKTAIKAFICEHHWVTSTDGNESAKPYTPYCYHCEILQSDLDAIRNIFRSS